MVVAVTITALQLFEAYNIQYACVALHNEVHNWDHNLLVCIGVLYTDMYSALKPHAIYNTCIYGIRVFFNQLRMIVDHISS